MAEHHFNVFGVLIAVVSTDTGGSSSLLGSDGKRRPADIVVLSFIEEQELGRCLADRFHELATPDNNEGIPILGVMHRCIVDPDRELTVEGRALSGRREGFHDGCFGCAEWLFAAQRSTDEPQAAVLLFSSGYIHCARDRTAASTTYHQSSTGDRRLTGER